MFRPVTADKVPLVTLDDATLLLAEKESRKTVAQAKTRMMGGGVNLLLMSPMAVVGIAKSANVKRREYWSHEELMKEIERRRLTVLPKTFDESNTALIGGQVVAIALGQSIGGMVGDAVGSGMAHFVATETTDNIVQGATVTASGKVTDGITTPLTVSNPQGTFSLPESSETATTHLNGVWTGFGQSEVAPTVESNSETTATPKRTGIKGLVTSAIGIAASHISSTTNAVKNATSSSTPLKTLVSGLSSSVVTTASAVVTVVTGKGADAIKEDFAVPIKYRMKFEFAIKGTQVSGKNLVDDLVVVGKCHESGTVIQWSETIGKYDGGMDLTVSYQAKVGGGQMQGSWSATDGRKGTFVLSHV
ncbi:UNVERIFIED_CONTAM: hypothetical protein HDU68_011466 [Siphonaria sp. JEL0065]|nr:hypothetical protein HDU68_011466 [Siphonaria sp. JEL0065]